MTPVEVFISSTVYDLLDLRPELTEFLRADGFKVRVSGGKVEDFDVEAVGDSIETCLTNVARSDVVVSIVDRRYGPVLPHGEHKNISATHAEIRHARKQRIPVFVFVRDKSLEEFAMMRRNGPDIKTNWVEPEKKDQRSRWYDFVKELSALEHHANWSNWYDPFTTSVDLKDGVRTRLIQRFPQQATSLALQPERLVRLFFVPISLDSFSNEVVGHFRNGTPGTALNVVHGWRLNNEDKVVAHRGALAFRENLVTTNVKHLKYPIPIEPQDGYRAVFCEYTNAFGDRYRVEYSVVVADQEVELPSVAGPHTASVIPERGFTRVFRPTYERFYILSGTRDEPQWVEVSTPPRPTIGPPPASSD